MYCRLRRADLCPDACVCLRVLATELVLLLLLLAVSSLNAFTDENSCVPFVFYMGKLLDLYSNRVHYQSASVA
jgi:hypothetical protein